MGGLNFSEKEFFPNEEVSIGVFLELLLSPDIALSLHNEEPNKSFLGVVFRAAVAFLDEYMSLMSKAEEYGQLTELDVV